MIKFLKPKKLNKNESDENALRILRQQITLNEQMKTYNLITDAEYQNNLIVISDNVRRLEQKYGLD